MAIGTIVASGKSIGYDVSGRRNSYELVLSWVASTDDGTIPSLLIDNFVGWYITKVRTIPGAAAAAPTALYDITFIDADGLDLMEGNLLNRSATLPEKESMAEQIGVGGFTATFAGQNSVAATGKIKILLNR